jgi:hypothetical protein
MTTGGLHIRVPGCDAIGRRVQRELHARGGPTVAEQATHLVRGAYPQAHRDVRRGESRASGAQLGAGAAARRVKEHSLGTVLWEGQHSEVWGQRCRATWVGGCNGVWVHVCMGGGWRGGGVGRPGCMGARVASKHAGAPTPEAPTTAWRGGGEWGDGEDRHRGLGGGCCHVA